MANTLRLTEAVRAEFLLSLRSGLSIVQASNYVGLSRQAIVDRCNKDSKFKKDVYHAVYAPQKARLDKLHDIASDDNHQYQYQAIIFLLNRLDGLQDVIGAATEQADRMDKLKDIYSAFFKPVEEADNVIESGAAIGEGQDGREHGSGEGSNAEAGG